jgi:hypothetical protein
MPKVLRIDRTSDDLTQGAFDYRQGFVYPKFLEKGFTLIPPLPATIASRDSVSAQDRDSGIVYITAGCHGLPNQLLGNGDEDLFPEGDYASEEVADRVVHFLACATALDLGPDLVEKGCRAFIGYNKIFIYEQAWADVFFRCDAQIDLALAEGETVARAIELAKQHFDAEISDPANAPVTEELAHRRDSLVGLSKASLDTIRLYDPAASFPRPIPIT